jgi:hypothetical protein
LDPLNTDDSDKEDFGASEQLLNDIKNGRGNASQYYFFPCLLHLFKQNQQDMWKIMDLRDAFKILDLKVVSKCRNINTPHSPSPSQKKPPGYSQSRWKWGPGATSWDAMRFYTTVATTDENRSSKRQKLNSGTTPHISLRTVSNGTPALALQRSFKDAYENTQPASVFNGV